MRARCYVPVWIASGVLLILGGYDGLEVLLPPFLAIPVGGGHRAGGDLLRLVDGLLLQALAAVVHGGEGEGGGAQQQAGGRTGMLVLVWCGILEVGRLWCLLVLVLVLAVVGDAMRCDGQARQPAYVRACSRRRARRQTERLGSRIVV